MDFSAGADFKEFWRANFPNCPPVSYLFKKFLNELWFRIHSLPESKRYAENNEETLEILRRQNILFKDLIGENEVCFLVCLGYNESPFEIYQHTLPTLTNLLTDESDFIPLQTIEYDRESDEKFRVAVGKRAVKFDDLTEILTFIADDELRHFFVLNPKTKRIFAPYDGGVDAILENRKKRDEIKNKYKDWLSFRSDGL